MHHATTYPFYKTQKKVKTKQKGKDGQISLSICIVFHNIVSFLSTSLLLVPFGRLKGQTWWIVQRKIPSRFVKWPNHYSNILKIIFRLLNKCQTKKGFAILLWKYDTLPTNKVINTSKFMCSEVLLNEHLIFHMLSITVKKRVHSSWQIRDVTLFNTQRYILFLFFIQNC